jgi:transaldolase/glucose-6-phosphate isomerase
LETLNTLGISMEEVAEQLLAEGLQLFSDAFDKLLKAVEKQSQGAGAKTSVA